MLCINKANFENVFCYRGKHELVLRPTAYSITAAYEDNEERSNWGGKSSLLKILGPLPLFGYHGVENEDSWITDGESYAEIKIELSDGTVVRRWRHRGKSTQAELVHPGGQIVGQKGFQAAVEDMLQLSKDDFMSSCMIRQKQTDFLLSIRPGERTSLVVNWLDLDQIKECERMAADELRKAIRDEETHQLKINHCKSDITEGFRGEELIEKNRERLLVIEEKLEILKDTVAKAAEVLAIKRTISEKKQKLLDIEKEGKALRATLKYPLLPEEIESLEVVANSYAQDLDFAKKEHRRLTVLAAGEFDGACPVSKGLQCPAKASINEDRARHAKELENVSSGLVEAMAEARQTEADLVAAKKAKAEFEEKTSRLSSLRQKWEKITQELNSLSVPEESGEDPVEEFAALNEEKGSILATIEAIQRAIDIEEMAKKTITLEEGKLKEASERRRICAAAVAVFKNAQRQCAESGLANIEAGANSLLQTAGIDLEVVAKWAKEGQGLAKVCEACGEPFPASAKVKSCARCQTARGPNLIEKLEIGLSNTSGGAEDLGGLALQISAAAWLRSQRGSTWGVAYLDEVTSALDPANRRAISNKISGMILGRFGFDQAFTVSHHSEISESFPNQVFIRVNRDGSRSVSAV
ncbi:MAG: hypothetical protein KGL39_18195 [Patescibacteria group bacterium]|nr:hypothetical protein [Patescibacteria group bacterium]